MATTFTFDTGRTRTLTVTFTISLDNPAEVTHEPVNGDWSPSRSQTRTEYQHESAWAPEGGGAATTLHCTFAASTDWDVGDEKFTHDGYAWIKWGPNGISPSYGGPIDGALGQATCSYTISVPVKERVSFTVDEAATSVYFNHQPYISVQVYEVTYSAAEGGAVMSMSISGDLSESGSETVGNNYVVPWKWTDDLMYSPAQEQVHRLGWYSWGGGLSCTNHIQGGLSFSLTNPALNQFYDRSEGELIAWVRVSSSMSGVHSTAYIEGHHGWMRRGLYPPAISPWYYGPYVMALDADFYKWDLSYPKPVEFWLAVGEYYADANPPHGGYMKQYVTDGTGHYGGTVTLHNYSWMDPYTGFEGTTYAYMDGTSGGWLETEGHRTADRGIAFWLKQVASIRLNHTDSLTVTDMTPFGDWTEGANTTLSDDGGAVKAIIAGGAGSYYQTYDTTDDKSLQHYRYVRVRCKADSATTMTIAITADMKTHPTDGDYNWRGARTLSYTIDVGTDYADVFIDTCCPDVNGSSPDLLDGLDGAITKIEFKNLVDERTYWVDYVKGWGDKQDPIDAAPLDHEVNVLPDYDWDIPKATKEACPPSRIMAVNVNGKNCLEGKLKAYSLSDLKTLLTEETTGAGAGNLGWTISEINPETPGDYYSNDLSGNGYTDDWSARELEEELHTQWVSGTNADLNRRIRVDQVTFYPNCGDFWTTGGYGALPLEWQKRLYSIVHGIIEDPANDDAEPGVIVDASRGGTDYGHRDPSDEIGHYWSVALMDPDVGTNYTLTATSASGTPSATEDVYSRRLGRQNLIGAGAVGAGPRDLKRDQANILLEVCVEDEKVVFRKSFDEGTTWEQATTAVAAVDAADVAVSCDWAGNVHASYIDGGDWKKKVSDDAYGDSPSWGAAVSVFTGGIVNIAEWYDWNSHYWFHAAVKGAGAPYDVIFNYSKDGETAELGSDVTVAADAADVGLGITMAGDGTLILRYRRDGTDADITMVSRQFGQSGTWS